MLDTLCFTQDIQSQLRQIKSCGKWFQQLLVESYILEKCARCLEFEEKTNSWNLWLQNWIYRVFSCPLVMTFRRYTHQKGTTQKSKFSKLTGFDKQIDSMHRGSWPWRVQIWPYILGRHTPSLSLWLFFSVTNGSKCQTNMPRWIGTGIRKYLQP